LNPGRLLLDSHDLTEIRIIALTDWPSIRISSSLSHSLLVVVPHIELHPLTHKTIHAEACDFDVCRQKRCGRMYLTSSRLTPRAAAYYFPSPSPCPCPDPGPFPITKGVLLNPTTITSTSSPRLQRRPPRGGKQKHYHRGRLKRDLREI
jgi:hypothetical protein